MLLQKGRHKGKVSIVAALAVTPTGRVRGMFFRLLVDQNVLKQDFVRFLRALRREFGATPLTIVWDRLQAHRSPEVRLFASENRITLEYLPPYAPELNPVEFLWSHLKMNALANFAPASSQHLARSARRAGRSLQRQPDLMRRIAYRCRLFFCDK